MLMRDAWFIIQNGNFGLRSLVLRVGDLYMDEGKLNESTQRETVLIISLTCICVTILSSIIFIPVTFALENEERKVVDHWLDISDETKIEVLKKVIYF